MISGTRFPVVYAFPVDMQDIWYSKTFVGKQRASAGHVLRHFQDVGEACRARVHVPGIPFLTCEVLVANESQLHTKVEHNWPNHWRDMEKGCARAHVLRHLTKILCKACVLWVPTHTANLNKIDRAISKIWSRGVHVRTCRDIPPMTCGEHATNESLSTYQIEDNRPNRSWHV